MEEVQAEAHTGLVARLPEFGDRTAGLAGGMTALSVLEFGDGSGASVADGGDVSAPEFGGGRVGGVKLVPEFSDRNVGLVGGVKAMLAPEFGDGSAGLVGGGVKVFPEFGDGSTGLAGVVKVVPEFGNGSASSAGGVRVMVPEFDNGSSSEAEAVRVFVPESGDRKAGSFELVPEFDDRSTSLVGVVKVVPEFGNGRAGGVKWVPECTDGTAILAGGAKLVPEFSNGSANLAGAKMLVPEFGDRRVGGVKLVPEFGDGSSSLLGGVNLVPEFSNGSANLAGCVNVLVPDYDDRRVGGAVMVPEFGNGSIDNPVGGVRKKASLAVFPEEVLEHVLVALTEAKDRNAASLVCKAWNRAEALTRRSLFVGNCYAVLPSTVTHRFRNLRSLSLKGKPRFSDFGMVPPNWGANVYPWVVALAEAYPCFESLRLKRMVVSDDTLALLAHSFPNFKSLVLTTCDGFSTRGLIPIASHCRHLRELELQECEVVEAGGEWLSSFPESFTSLVRLNFACTASQVDGEALVRLAGRCRSLQSLRVNVAVSLDHLARALLNAPLLTDLGTGSFACFDRQRAPVARFEAALRKCKGLESLSGFWDATPACLPSIYIACPNLTSLNLSYVTTLQSDDLVKLICNCPKLQRLWVLDYIEDGGLQAVASACKLLEELRVFPVDTGDRGRRQGCVTEEGLVAIAKGCTRLTSVLYFCEQMTNAALMSVASHSPQFTCFRLCILEPRKPDPTTGGPLDEGFGAIVKACPGLRRFSLSGLLTDQAFAHIGRHGANLQMLSIAFAGESDLGMTHILQGCPKLNKLEIRDSPFGDTALLSGMHRYNNMRSLWMSSCKVTIEGCHRLARQTRPSLNIEIIKEDVRDCYAERLYVYRTIAGPRQDIPDFVSIF